MPYRNSLKINSSDSYYHVYSRGVNKSLIFRSSEDYSVFLGLLKRYLSKKQAVDKDGKVYPNLYDEVELLSYCLMPNHFHMLIFQKNSGDMQRLMRSVMTSYSMYFNKTYKRTGPMFEGRYRASRIINDSYLMHISRYIHLNPTDWRSYNYSSLPYYLKFSSAEWVRPARIQELFKSPDEYWLFMADYEDYKKQLKLIKKTLANS